MLIKMDIQGTAGCTTLNAIQKELVILGLLVVQQMTIKTHIYGLNETKEVQNEKNETKTAPAGHYYTKSGNLVKGRLTKDAEERGARKSDPKDKMRSKTPPVTQYNPDEATGGTVSTCLLYTSPSPRDGLLSRMPSSA